MTPRLPAQILLAVAMLALAACSSKAPPPATEDEALDDTTAVVAEEPAPAPAPTPALPPPPAAPVVIPPDAIGGTPVTNIQEAFVRGNAGMQKYCVDQGIPCDSFYVKDTIMEGEAWILQFFGNPHNEGMYVNVRVFQDGRAEIER
jgi:hypothetical protein